MTSSKSKTKSNRRYEHTASNNNNIHHELQFPIDIDGEDEYVDEELLSINDDYLSVSSSSSALATTTTNASFDMKKTHKKLKNNFFTLTTTTAQQAARHLIKLFTNTKKQKTITTITRTTTLTTTLKAAAAVAASAVKHRDDNNDEEFTDDEYIIDDEDKKIELNKLKFNRHYQMQTHQQHTYRSTKQHQIHHRIPFHQKVNTKNLKSIQIKLDRFSNNINNGLTQVNSSTVGLGFTIVGYCPCQIGKVESNSIAFNAGLTAGDLIIKINGKNVSRATCDSIVKIIK